MKNAPDDVLSFGEAAFDVCKSSPYLRRSFCVQKFTELSQRISIDYTMDHSFRNDQYHLKVIQINLTQRLSTILPEIVSEVTLAWQDNTGIGDEWTEVNVWDVMLKVISRTINRMFIGLPLCRNQELLNNLVEYATATSKSGAIIDMTPRIFRRLVVLLLSLLKFIRILLNFC